MYAADYMPVETTVSQAQAPALERAYYPGLNGIRALAMLVVFVHHYNPRPTMPVVSAIVSQGNCGVQFFFVLSGFLITGILWDSRERDHKMRDFYARRVLRIFPLYYGFWLALLLLTPIIHWHWNWRWLMYLGHLGNYVRFVFPNPQNVG